MSVTRILKREDLESIQASVLGPPGALVIEYWIAGQSGVGGGPPILELALSDEGTRSVNFGGGSEVEVELELLKSLIETSFEELDAWAARTRDFLAHVVKKDTE